MILGVLGFWGFGVSPNEETLSLLIEQINKKERTQGTETS